MGRGARVGRSGDAGDRLQRDIHGDSYVANQAGWVITFSPIANKDVRPVPTITGTAAGGLAVVPPR
jgi:hypothetical protein